MAPHSTLTTKITNFVSRVTLYDYFLQNHTNLTKNTKLSIGRILNQNSPKNKLWMVITIFLSIILITIAIYCYWRNARDTKSQKSSISPPALTKSLNSDFFDHEVDVGLNIDTEESEDDSVHSDRIDLTKQLLIRRQQGLMYAEKKDSHIDNHVNTRIVNSKMFKI